VAATTTVQTTLWCPKHAPPPIRLPIVGWATAVTLQHPGRDDAPAATELQDRLPQTLSPDPLQTAALATQEESRWRVILELRRFELWL
jgi:hypothetical protein